MENKYAYEYLKERLALNSGNTAASLILKRMVSQLNFDPFLSETVSDEKLLQGDGTHEIDEALNGFIENYLNPSLKFLSDPFLISGMEKAVGRITKAILDDESICIYGDYDVDGITSTSFLVSFLRELRKIIKPGGPDSCIFYKLPDRIKDGYGLGIEPIDEISGFINKNAEKPLSLLITVDLGITNTAEAAYAASKNIDVIICDHHEVPVNGEEEILPQCFAVLNPKRKGDRFPFKFLPGVGIAFNLGIALRKHLVMEGLITSYPNLKDYLDIVCLGIIADIVPMYGDNRTLTYYGLKILNENPRPGIRELKRICGLHFDNINESDVAWKIAPKINAAGRVGNPAIAVELLTQNDRKTAYDLAQEMESLNRKRQMLEDVCFNEAVNIIEEKKKIEEKAPIIIIKGDSWHPGVIGIVSSKLADFMQKPVLILTGYKNEVYIGSARSCGDADIYAFLKNYEAFFAKFGGHKMACGLTVRKGKDAENFISAVTEDFPAGENGGAGTGYTAAGRSVSESKPAYDEEINLGLLSDDELSGVIKRMSPYGPLNEQPRFLIRNITLLDISRKEFRNKNSKKNNFSNCYFTLNIKESSENKNAKHKAMMFNRHNKPLENMLKINGSGETGENKNKIDVNGIVVEFYNGYLKILNLIS